MPSSPLPDDDAADAIKYLAERIPVEVYDETRYTPEVRRIMDENDQRCAARYHLAWLMWCFDQGYVNASDRVGMTNWLLEDPATLHVDDAALRPHLLAMADEILAALETERV